MFHLQQLSMNIAKLYFLNEPLTLFVVPLSLEPISSKRMRRLVSIHVFYILGGGYIAYGITQMLSVFPMVEPNM